MVSGVPLVPFSECKITDFFHFHQMFSQLFFKKKLREKDKALKDNALRPEKKIRHFAVDNTAKVGNDKNMAKTCGGIFRVLCRRTWFRKENWERKTVIALLYIYGQSFLNVTVALTLRQNEQQCCAPSYAMIFFYSSVRRLRQETIFCCLLAAGVRAARGRR